MTSYIETLYYKYTLSGIIKLIKTEDGMISGSHIISPSNGSIDLIEDTDIIGEEVDIDELLREAWGIEIVHCGSCKFFIESVCRNQDSIFYEEECTEDMRCREGELK